jgi:hypothetical protein
MDSAEFARLQAALVWMFWPIIQAALGVMLGLSIITAIYIMFSRIARWLTHVEG